jgi:hypothetical protein
MRLVWLVGKSLTRFGSIGTCSGMVIRCLIYGLIGLGWSSSSVVQVKSSSSVNIEDSLHVCSPTSLYTVLQGCVGMNQCDYGRVGASISSLVSWLARQINIFSNVPSARLFLDKLRTVVGLVLTQF